MFRFRAFLSPAAADTSRWALGFQSDKQKYLMNDDQSGAGIHFIQGDIRSLDLGMMWATPHVNDLDLRRCTRPCLS